MSAKIRLSPSSAARLSVVPDDAFAQSGADAPQVFVALLGAGGFVPKPAGFDHVDLAASTFAACTRGQQPASPSAIFTRN